MPPPTLFFSFFPFRIKCLYKGMSDKSFIATQVLKLRARKMEGSGEAKQEKAKDMFFSSLTDPDVDAVYPLFG